MPLREPILMIPAVTALLQVPPLLASLKVAEEPKQTVPVPVIADGSVVTETVVDEVQPVASNV